MAIIVLISLVISGCPNQGHETEGVTFTLTVDDSFPAGEAVYMDGDGGIIKMDQTGTYTWQTTLSASGEFRYAYMRNNIVSFAAAEEFVPDESPSTWSTHRVIDIPASGNYQQQDTGLFHLQTSRIYLYLSESVQVYSGNFVRYYKKSPVVPCVRR